MTGMSQTKLAQLLGITFQQVQKYETAANRLSAARLYQLARLVRVPITYFYEEWSDAAGAVSPKDMQKESAFDRETTEFARVFRDISDPTKRRMIYELIRTVAKFD